MLSKKKCRLTLDPNIFATWDGGNFVLTPSQYQPIALVAGDKVFIKPTLSTGYLDYVKKHPTIGASQGSLFSPTGDNILVNLILADYYSHIQEPELQAAKLKLAGAI